MNIPQLTSCEDQAVDTVVSVLNKAREKLGDRQTLKQLATSRDLISTDVKVSLKRLGNPLASTCMDLIKETIEKQWKLTDTVMYTLKYIGGSQDECSRYYYFELKFRIEGHRAEHDVRYVKLTADWLLSVIQMKINLFKRIEQIRLF